MGTPFLDFDLTNPEDVFRDRATREAFFDEQGVRRGLTPAEILGQVVGTGLGGPPKTRTRMDHAFTIRTDRGRIIGAAHAISFQQGQQIDDVYEVNADGHGKPVDMVDQVLSTRTISLARYDLFSIILEELFGSRELVTIKDQIRGFELREIWRGPSGILGGGRRIYRYIGCKFEDWGRQLDAKGDRVVSVDASIRWLDRRKIL